MANRKIEDFIICDFTNTNRKPKNEKLNSFGAKFAEALAIDEFDLISIPDDELTEINEIEHKLHSYIEEEGMKLMLSLNEISPAFVSSASGYSVVMITKEELNGTPDMRICSIAHELGHYFDYKYNFNYDSSEFAGYETSSRSEVITEVIAWAYAKDMLEFLGYENWNKFEEVAIESLATYTLDIVESANYISNLDTYKNKREMLRMMLCYH